MERESQRSAFENATAAFYAAQDASDAAAEKAGKTRAAQETAKKAYDAAIQHQRDRVKGANTEVDKTTEALETLQAQDPIDTKAAQTAWDASQNAFQTLSQALVELNTNPGAVEQV